MTISVRSRALVLKRGNRPPTGFAVSNLGTRMMVLITTLLLALAAPVMQTAWTHWVRGLFARDNGQSVAVRRFAQMTLDQVS